MGDNAQVDDDEIRRLLVERGCPGDEIDPAIAERRAAALLLEQIVMPYTDRFSTADLEEELGDFYPLAQQLWRAMGFPETDRDALSFNERDLAAVRLAVERFERTGLPREILVQNTRLMASSISRVAEGIIDVLLAMPDDQTTDLSQLQQCQLVSLLDIDSLAQVLDYMFRRQLVHAARHRVALPHGAGTAGPAFAIGFADIVDYTKLSGHLAPDDLGQLVLRFETTSRDLVADLGGRVVKTIGDAVMFAADDVDGALGIAKAMIDAHAGDPLLPPVRVGIDVGRVVAISGDYFGPVVNRASRITAEGEAGEILVSDSVVATLGESSNWRFNAVGSRSLKGIGPTELYRVTVGET